jgi:NADPH-dependent ferric siderophore reductase
MIPLIASAIVELPEVKSILAPLLDRLEEHGATVSRLESSAVIELSFGNAELTVENGGLGLRAVATDAASLIAVKALLSEHVLTFAHPNRPVLAWQGEGFELTTPPNFRLLHVVSARNVTPHIRRITFRGSDLAYYASDTDYHVKLLIPPFKDRQPEWPTSDADGTIRFPQGENAPVLRKYTIRAIDVEQGTLDIDFVLHDDTGPASKWAVEAVEGNVIGVLHRSAARDLRPADWYLLAGDETALPAIARMLETLPDTARGVALIEVTDKAEEQPVVQKPGFGIRWLHRNGAKAGTTTLLQDAVRTVEWPVDGTPVHIWIAAEFDAFKNLRAYIRQERGVPTANQLVLSYWRKGKTDAEAEMLPDDD